MEENKNTNLLNWALDYAKNNWAVLPLHHPNDDGSCSCGNPNCKSIGKHPILKNCLKMASTDKKTITQWWSKWPKANIGILTGTKSGLFVVDIDPRHGGDDSIQSWEQAYFSLKGLSVQTGGNGIHYYYKYPYSTIVKNKTNVFPGIDIRGEGGFVVAPPSIHVSGNQYSWKSSLEDISESPNTNFIKINKTVTPKVVKSVIPEGQRNNFLASMAGLFRKHGLTQLNIEQQLSLINDNLCFPTLSSNEVARVAKSISKYSPSPETLWDSPKELPQIKHTVPALNHSLIPDQLKDWSLDISQRMQVPVEFILTPTLVALGSLIGRKLGIFPKQNDNWFVIPNLWGGIVAKPGTFKSPSIAEALRPLEKLVSKENDFFEKRLKTYEIDKTISEATSEAIKGQLVRAIKKSRMKEAEDLKNRLMELIETDETKVPTCKRYKTNDATIEKLSQLLVENPTGLLLVRDELAGWLCSMQKFGREGDREFYLEAWNGYGSYTVDRIGRGTVHIPALCLSIFGGIQPDKLNKYLTSNLDKADDGLLQRFQILIWPELGKNWENYDQLPDVKAESKVTELFENLDELHCFEKSEGIRFSPEAQNIFNEWRTKLEKLIRSETIKNVHYESHIAKYRSLVPSLALIFYLIDKNGVIESKSSIDANSIKLAIRWCEFLDHHAKKVYKVNEDPYQQSIHTFIKKIKEKKIKDGDSVRNVHRHHWAHLKTNEQVMYTVNYLSELNWIKTENISDKNRESLIIRINPKLNLN